MIIGDGDGDGVVLRRYSVQYQIRLWSILLSFLVTSLLSSPSCLSSPHYLPTFLFYFSFCRCSLFLIRFLWSFWAPFLPSRALSQLSYHACTFRSCCYSYMIMTMITILNMVLMIYLFYNVTVLYGLRHIRYRIRWSIALSSLQNLRSRVHLSFQQYDREHTGPVSPRRVLSRRIE